MVSKLYVMLVRVLSSRGGVASKKLEQGREREREEREIIIMQYRFSFFSFSFFL